MPTDIYTEFLAVIDALNEACLDYAVCGGIGLAIHGHPRFTRNIDFLIQAESWNAIRGTLAPSGYTLAAGPIPFDTGKPTARELMRLSKATGEDEELLTLDFLLVAPSLEDAWAHREVYSWQGRQIRAVSRESLADMKRLAGRPQDLADLAVLEGNGNG